MSRRNLIVTLLMLLLASAGLNAQSRYNLAFRFAFVHTVDSNPLLIPDVDAHWGNGNNLFAETEFNLTGAHRQFDLGYSFGRQNNPEIVNRNSNIHQFFLHYSEDFSPTVHFSLNDLASYTNDYTPGDVYSGDVGEVPPIQDPTGIYLGRVDQLRNLANAELLWQLNSRSDVRLIYSNRFIQYGESATGVSDSESMQHTVETHYQRRLSSRFSIGGLYRFQYIDFTDYDTTKSHAVLGSVAWQLRPTVSLSGAAGPLYSDNAETGISDVFLTANASLIKSLENDQFSVTYARDLADTDGLFGASISDMVYVTWRRVFFRDLDWSLSAGYSHETVLDSPTRTENWFAASGLRYRIHQRFDIFAVYRWSRQDIEEGGSAVTLRNQFVAGVRFTIPHAWRKEG